MFDFENPQTELDPPDFRPINQEPATVYPSDKRKQVIADPLKTETLPPHSEMAEDSALGCVFASWECLNELIDQIHGDPLAFYCLPNRVVFKSLVEMKEQQIPIEFTTLWVFLKDRNLCEAVGGITRLMALPDLIPSAANLPAYVQIINDKYALRRVQQVASDVAGAVHSTNGHQKSEQLMDEVEQVVKEARKLSTPVANRSINTMIQGVLSKIEWHHTNQGKLMGLPTGFHDLDRRLMGMNAQEMIVLAARPSTGKSSLMMAICEQLFMIERQPVGIFSLEMSDESLVFRSMCSLGRINSRDIKDGHLTEKDFAKIAAISSKLNLAPLHICDQSALTVIQLKAKARRMVEDHGVKFIAIDYLQLLHGSRDYKSREAEVSSISNGVKELARELHIPILILSQLNRDLEKRKGRPMLSDIRESGCLSVKTTKLLTSTGILCNQSSLMNTYSLNTVGSVVIRPTKNIPKPVKPMVRLVLKSGRFIDCTPAHPVLTDQGFVPASKITAEHSIAAVRKIDEPSGRGYIPEAKWIGWMLGNGSSVGYASPAFICSCQTVAKAFEAATFKHFGLIPKPHAHKCSKVFQYDITAGPVRTSAGNPCKDWMKSHDLWGRRSQNKIIPSWFLEQANNRSIAELLSGLFETDGTATKNSVKFSTTSNEMAWQVVWCLARIGIFCYIDGGFLSEKANFPCFTIRIADGRDVALFKKEIPMIGRKLEKLNSFKLSKSGSRHGDRVGKWVQFEIRKARKKIGITWARLGYKVQLKRISKDDLAKLIPKLPLDHLAHLISPSIYWDQMQSISKIYDGEVFDREVVGGPHNFVANGIIVHNSIEADADTVLLLSKIPVEDPQEQNAIPMLLEVAKQRNGETGDVHLTFIKSLTRFESAARVSYE